MPSKQCKPLLAIASKQRATTGSDDIVVASRFWSHTVGGTASALLTVRPELNVTGLSDRSGEPSKGGKRGYDPLLPPVKLFQWLPSPKNVYRDHGCNLNNDPGVTISLLRHIYTVADREAVKILCCALLVVTLHCIDINLDNPLKYAPKRCILQWNTDTSSQVYSMCAPTVVLVTKCMCKEPLSDHS